MCECDLCKYYREENDYCGYSDMGNGDVRYAPCYRTQYEEGYVDGQKDGMKWIPVSEALPEKKEMVLITNKKSHVRCGQYQGIFEDKNYRWWWKHNTLEEVLAWMPLPEPWKGE